VQDLSQGGWLATRPPCLTSFPLTERSLDAYAQPTPLYHGKESVFCGSEHTPFRKKNSPPDLTGTAMLVCRLLPVWLARSGSSGQERPQLPCDAGGGGANAVYGTIPIQDTRRFVRFFMLSK
jgi:hypothetical protein